MPTAQGNLKYVMVAVDYFSKWIEAKALTRITSEIIQKFFWQNIIYRFDVPKSLTVENGTKFDSKAFRALCSQVGNNIHFASVKHPESNRLVERANDIILLGIIKSLVGLPKGKWTEELIKVLWNHNTSVSRSTRFTPFRLLFGDKAVTLEEVKLGSARVMASAEDEDNEKISKYAKEESRLKAIEHIRKYQSETIRWRYRKVKLKNMSLGHLVLRRVANPDTVGKLQVKWEVLFLVSALNRPGSYRLRDMEENEIPRSWNVDELRRYCV
jgi:hypothetical protein